MAEPLQKIIASRYGGRNLPVALVLPDGGRVPLSSDPEIEIVARSFRGLKALASPALGALARAYVSNEIDFTGSARRVLGIVETMVGDIAHGRDSLRTRFRLWRHQHRSNRANIQYHYDVSNAFYKLWLDSRSVYSCAYFKHADDTLDDAQAQKLDHICRKLRLAPGERFLDIGCGWGGLLFWAAQHYGVQASGITLSRNQFEHVTQQIKSLGLSDRVDVRLLDYLDLPEDDLYDKIASVGMFEHVGLRNLPVYFNTVRRLLKERGLFLNHGITTMDTSNRAVGLGAGEFIGRYVFPYGELPHLHLVVHDMADQDLEVHDVEGLRTHYAKTLGHWSDNFEARMAEAVAAASDRTARIWRVYLAGCAHAFEQGWISIYQILATKQTKPGRAVMPLTREYMYR